MEYRSVPNRYVIWWHLKVIPLVLVRPWLWKTALRFLCWPPWKAYPYLKFRFETMYGSYEKGNPKDIVRFLWWAKRYPR